MKELIRTDDVVKISLLVQVLSEAQIEAILPDAHSHIAFSGTALQRIMVSEDDFEEAKRLLNQFEES